MDHNPKNRVEQICDVIDFLNWIWGRRRSGNLPPLDKMIDQVGELDYLGELHRLLYEEE